MRLVIAVSCLLALAPAQSQRFRVNVDAVRADVLVMDGRRPVTGLTAADFEVRDKGVVQQIESVVVEDVPISLMFALDTSQSVDGAPLVHLKDAATAVIRLLAPADRAALMTFNGSIRLLTPWTADHSKLLAGIAGAEAFGSTTLYDASYAALMLRDPEPGRTLVLIFSDGADTMSWLPGINVLEVARRTDAVVYGVSMKPALIAQDNPNSPDPRDKRYYVPPLGYRLDFHSGMQDTVRDAPTATLLESVLEAMAEETGGKVFEAERSDQLRDTFIRVITEFRSRYLISYTPRGVDGGGWHPLEVKLKGRKGKVTARRGYLR